MKGLSWVASRFDPNLSMKHLSILIDPMGFVRNVSQVEQRQGFQKKKDFVNQLVSVFFGHMD